MENSLEKPSIVVKGNGNQIGRCFAEPMGAKIRMVLLGLGFALGVVVSCIVYVGVVLFCE